MCERETERQTETQIERESDSELKLPSAYLMSKPVLGLWRSLSMTLLPSMCLSYRRTSRDVHS